MVENSLNTSLEIFAGRLWQAGKGCAASETTGRKLMGEAFFQEHAGTQRSCPFPDKDIHAKL